MKSVSNIKSIGFRLDIDRKTYYRIVDTIDKNGSFFTVFKRFSDQSYKSKFKALLTIFYTQPLTTEEGNILEATM